MSKIKQAKSSSFSRATVFEECPLKFKLMHIDKIPDPCPELPKGQEHPLDRGIRIHTLAEHYVQGKIRGLPSELASFEDQFTMLRALYERGIVKLETPLAFDRTWNPSGYKDWENTIYRAKADATVYGPDNHIITIDFKTGKRDGNEIKHHEQCMEYAICQAMLNPEAQEFTLQLWYLDQPRSDDNPFSEVFSRERVLSRFPDMKKRHESVINARLFPAYPSRHSCFFCPYKAGSVGRKKNSYPGTGHCRRNVC